MERLDCSSPSPSCPFVPSCPRGSVVRFDGSTVWCHHLRLPRSGQTVKPSYYVRFLLALLALLVAAADALPAQSLRDRFSQLFIFGPGADPLFLAGSANTNNPLTIQAHGTHYVPAAVSQNGALIGFLSEALAAAVANAPVGATSGGETFRFEGGVPVRTSSSAGPIFAERAQTLGRGRLLTGIGRSQFRFRALRGVPLEAIDLIFTHENVDFAGCDEAFGGDCTQMGVPTLENDIMLFRLGLDLDVTVHSLYATYGVSDRVDVGVVLPLVRTRLSGRSHAQVVPFGGPTAAHFFAGRPETPELVASRAESGSAFGLGDVTVRVKALLRQTDRVSVALLGDARFATGDSEDLLGAGHMAARGLAVFSGRRGNFSPHLNVGYAFRHGDTQTDAVLGTAGFDHLMAPGITLAADLVTELQVGRSPLRLPQTVHFDTPFERDVMPSAIPDVRDDLVNGSLGAKYSPRDGLFLVGNLLVPLNQGGVRPRTTWTWGVEYTF